MAFKKRNIEKGIFNKVLVRDIMELEDESTRNIKIIEKSPQVNVIGMVVDKLSENEIFIDDSTGTIRVKSFNSDKSFENVEIGNIILLLGKIRILNSQKLISFIGYSQVGEDWLNLRKSYLKDQKNDFKSSKSEKIQEIEEEYRDGEENYEDADYEESEDESQVFYKLIDRIEELDKGEGCSYEELYNSFKTPKETIEKYLNYLIQEGQIFEITSGFLKVV